MTVDGGAQQHAARVCAAEEFVRAAIAGHDSSHDWWHVHRVRNTALALAQQEGLTEVERRLAELAALVHDVADRKYSADAAADSARLQRFLASGLGLGAADVATVMSVVDRMSFSASLAGGAAAGAAGGAAGGDGGAAADGAAAAGGTAGGAAEGPLQRSRRRILAVVQDADRLDAIGAVGVARCLTFGGRFGRVLHDPSVPPRTQLTAEAYTDKAAAAQQTTMNHFPEKLLKLKDLMLTAAGRAAAEGRHAFMLQFLRQFDAEWRGEA